MSRFLKPDTGNVFESGWVGQTTAQTDGESTNTFVKRKMDVAQTFREVFTRGRGPDVLSSLRAHAYGPPRFEIGSPNMVEVSLIRGGLHEMVEFIDYQIKLAEQGEYNVKS